MNFNRLECENRVIDLLGEELSLAGLARVDRREGGIFRCELCLPVKAP